MVIMIKKIIFIFLLFFTFNTLEVDSNSDKNLVFDSSDFYIEDTFKIYLNNVNSIDLDNVIKDLDISILSYEIDNNKYYARDIDELINQYILDKSLEEKIYYENKGINIDSIIVRCDINNLIKLQNIINIY